MSLVVKNRLIYIGLAIVCYLLGFQFIPHEVDAGWRSLPVVMAVIGYFAWLPLMYWLLVIKSNNQQSWKLIFVYSISSMMAYYSFPQELAAQFDFILLLRYPVLFLIGVVECYMLFGIVKGLWQCRHLNGDPRINIINEYKAEDEKKSAMAVMFATELTSWFYAIPYFSRQQRKRAYQISLLSGTRYHWIFAMIGLVLVSGMAFIILKPWSTIGAYFISGLIFYSVVLFTANYRMSRYYSLYFQDGKLVINNSIFGFLLVNLEEVVSVHQHDFLPNTGRSGLHIGRQQDSQIEIIFNHQQTYYAAMGTLTEKVEKVYLSLSHEDLFMREITQALSVKEPQVSFPDPSVDLALLDECV